MKTKPAKYAKLDTYDYDLDFDVDRDEYAISIEMKSDSDISIADVSTMVTASDGFIYVEGLYLILDDMRILYGDDKPVALLIYARELTLKERLGK